MEHAQITYFNFFAITTTAVGILLLLIFFFFCGLIFTISERDKHTKSVLFARTLTKSVEHFYQKNGCMIIEQSPKFAT